MIQFIKKLMAKIRNKEDDILDGQMKEKIGKEDGINPPGLPKDKDNNKDK